MKNDAMNVFHNDDRVKLNILVFLRYNEAYVSSVLYQQRVRQQLSDPQSRP